MGIVGNTPIEAPEKYFGASFGSDLPEQIHEIPDTLEDLVYEIVARHPNLRLVRVYPDDAMVITTGSGLTYIIQGYPKDEVEWMAGELILEIMRDRADPPFSAWLDSNPEFVG
jgi:hypothetical protein